MIDMDSCGPAYPTRFRGNAAGATRRIRSPARDTGCALRAGAIVATVLLPLATSAEAAPGPADGQGRVFIPNPVVALEDATLRDLDDSAAAVPEPAYRIVTLRDLRGSGTPEDPYTLTGPHVTTEGTPQRASELTGSFLFYRDDPRFEEVMVYYHIDTIQRRIQSLGFTDVCNRQVQVFVNSRPPGIPYDADQARYIPDGNGTGVLAFGSGGVDSAEDGEVIAHEYGHAVLDHQVPDFGESREALALAEGFADFLSAAMFSSVSRGFGDVCIGEWKAADSPADPPHCLRNLDGHKRYPYDMTYSDRHADGEIWGGALWELAGALDVDTVLRLAIAGNFLLKPDASFTEAGESLLLADADLFGAAHESAIREILLNRGILKPPLRIDNFTVKEENTSIPDSDPFGIESAIDYREDQRILSGLSLQVYVDIGHTVPPDLEVTLVSPAGTEIPLTPPWSFPTIYGALDAPETGSFASLVGESARGLWRLRVVDGTTFEVGELRAWGLRLLNITRGDANGDDAVDLTDAVYILRYLFSGGPLSCETGADSNDDGRLDVSDAIYLLVYLFAGGSAPPPPFEAPGADPSLDELNCANA